MHPTARHLLRFAPYPSSQKTFHFSFFNYLFITLYYKQTNKQTNMAGGVGRLVFTNQKSVDNQNHYVPGSGVGGRNISVRRHLKRFATSPQLTKVNGTYQLVGRAPCCPELLQNYGYIQK
jgi:hypothetical protein